MIMYKPPRKFYFSARHLRFSLTIIVIASLITTLLFTYLVKVVGHFFEKLGYDLRGNIPALIVVILGYAIIVFALTYFFSHRFIGPFERLKTDMSIILDGFYHRRLETRDQDDIYIRSFIYEVNSMLDEFESLCRSREELRNIINSDLKNIISLMDSDDISHKGVRKSLLSLKEKIEDLHERSCIPCRTEDTQ